MKYSLRSLMIVVLLAAVGACWLGDHLRMANENEWLTNEVDRLKEDEGGWRATAHILVDVMKENGWKAKGSEDRSVEVVVPNADQPEYTPLPTATP